MGTCELSQHEAIVHGTDWPSEVGVIRLIGTGLATNRLLDSTDAIHLTGVGNE